MSIWTKEKPPTYRPDAVATPAGWTDPETGEVLACIRDHTTKAGEANPIAVEFGAETYAAGAPLTVTVRFNEYVDVTPGATLNVTADVSGAIALTSTGGTKVNVVTFEGAVAPGSGEVLTIDPQSIVGAIVDTGTAVASDLVITTELSSAAGSRVVS